MSVLKITVITLFASIILAIGSGIKQESHAAEKISGGAVVEGIISGDNVNVRKNAGTSAEVIMKLNKGSKVRIIESSEDKIFAGKYFGSWVKIETSGKITGYVFSSFLSYGGIRPEEFHLFFDRFKSAWQKKNMSVISDHADFPLQLDISEDGDLSSEKIEKKDFFNRVTIREPFMYELSFEIDESGMVKAMYGYEGQQYALFFNLKNGRWTLVKIEIGRC